MKRRILVVEDMAERIAWFRMATIGMEVDYTDDPKVALKLLAENQYTQIFLDHDLAQHHYTAWFNSQGEELSWNDPQPFDEETGFCVARFLGENPERSPDAEIFVHSLNDFGAQRMVRELHKGRRQYRRVPFNQLKELARI